MEVDVQDRGQVDSGEQVEARERGRRQNENKQRTLKHVTSWMTCGWSECARKTPWATMWCVHTVKVFEKNSRVRCICLHQGLTRATRRNNSMRNITMAQVTTAQLFRHAQEHLRSGCRQRSSSSHEILSFSSISSVTAAANMSSSSPRLFPRSRLAFFGRTPEGDAGDELWTSSCTRLTSFQRDQILLASDLDQTLGRTLVLQIGFCLGLRATHQPESTSLLADISETAPRSNNHHRSRHPETSSSQKSACNRHSAARARRPEQPHTHQRQSRTTWPTTMLPGTRPRLAASASSVRVHPRVHPLVAYRPLSAHAPSRVSSTRQPVGALLRVNANSTHEQNAVHLAFQFICFSKCCYFSHC